MDEILAKMGLKMGHLATGLIAGLMGFMFNKKPSNISEKIRSWVVVFSGAILTGYITPLVLLKWDFLESAEYSVAFVVGLFGMGIVESIFILINTKKNDLPAIIKGIRDIFKR